MKSLFYLGIVVLAGLLCCGCASNIKTTHAHSNDLVIIERTQSAWTLLAGSQPQVYAAVADPKIGDTRFQRIDEAENRLSEYEKVHRTPSRDDRYGGYFSHYHAGIPCYGGCIGSASARWNAVAYQSYARSMPPQVFYDPRIVTYPREQRVVMPPERHEIAIGPASTSERNAPMAP